MCRRLETIWNDENSDCDEAGQIKRGSCGGNQK